MLKRLIKISIFAFLCLGFLGFAKVQANAGELNMHVINIGHGDAILFESQGHYMLVDSGLKDNKDVLLDYLDKNMEGTTIDYAVATHADKDHIGGFYYVFKKYDIKNLTYSEPTKEHFDDEGQRTSFGRFEDAIAAEAKEGLVYDNAYEGQTWTFGDATVKVLYDGRQGTTYNESSIVMKVTCDNKSILMTGDLPTTMEEKLIDLKYDLGANILKVAHHGAAASTSTNFLKAVNPQSAVIPNGIVDGVFLPKASVLQRLALRFIKTHLVTDGDIVMNIKDGVISTNHPENKEYECISKGTITLDKAIYYAPEVAGNPVIPNIQVHANGQLIPSTGYNTTIKGNTHTGVATIKISGAKAKYVGSLSTTFKILPRKTKFYSTLRSGKELFLHWNAQTSCSGYEIVYSTSKNFKSKTKTVIINNSKTNTKILKGLSKKKDYYIKARAFTNEIGYGKWSKVKKIKKIKVKKKKKKKKK